MRDGTPENYGFRVASRAGLPVPAPPFAQRDSKLAKDRRTANCQLDDRETPEWVRFGQDYSRNETNK